MARRIKRKIENNTKILHSDFYWSNNFDRFIRSVGANNVTIRSFGGFGHYVYHMPQQNATLYYEIRIDRNEVPPFNSITRVDIIIEGKDESCSEIERKILEGERKYQTKAAV